MTITTNPAADAERHEDEREAKQAALDARVLEAYGPGYVPEFVEQALKAAPLATIRKICTQSNRLLPSYSDGRNDYALKNAGAALFDWLEEFAYQCAAQDLEKK